MTYDEFMSSIIQSRGQWNSELKEYDAHHIIPRCMGGEPKEKSHLLQHANIIWLTKDEHIKAHALLVEKYPENKSLLMAYKIMTGKRERPITLNYQGSNNPNSKYVIETTLNGEETGNKWGSLKESASELKLDYDAFKYIVKEHIPSNGLYYVSVAKLKKISKQQKYDTFCCYKAYTLSEQI